MNIQFVQKTIFLITFSLFLGALNAQYYTEEEILDYCWKEHKYTKAEEDYPEEWNKQSAIFLHYEKKYEVHVTTDYKLYVAHIGHYRVKILDQAGLEDFSEVYYTQGAHGGYKLQSDTRELDYLNIKIIKPDGKEIIVEKKEIIEDDEGRRKIAIPNLEIGDILDYSLYTYDALSLYTCYYAIIEEMTLNRSYPVRHFYYTVVTDNNWDVQFTSGEHKIDLNERSLDNDRYQFSIEEKNVERIESNRWNYYYRTGSYIRMYVAYSDDNLTPTGKKGEPQHTYKLSDEDIIGKYREYYKKDNSAANEYAAFRGYVKRKYNKEEISNKKALEEYYYFIRHKFTNAHYVYDRYHNNGNPRYYRKLSDLDFTGHIIYALKKMKIPYDIVVVVARSSGSIKDVINKHQTDYLIRAKLEDEYLYFYRPTPYTRFNKFPSQIENVEGYIVDAEDKKGRNLSAKIVMLPSSKHKENISNYQSTIQFDKEDMTKLKASTKAKHTGHQIEDYQFDVVDWVNMIWEENKLYKTKLWGHPTKYKSKEVADFVAAQAEKRKEAFEHIATNHFDIGEDDTKLTNFATQTTANTANDSDLQFSFDCELSNLVKKVGPNYILKAGKLVGGQLNLREEEQERTVHIYMDYARGYEYTVNIEIPEGYEVKGLSNFENNIDNETGTLKSSATLSGNILTIEFIKYYKHNFEPAKNWDLMKEFLKPGAEFATKEILLKKKK